MIEADEERPTSPWTPSYSVTTQGSSVQDEITELKPLSSPVLEEPGVEMKAAEDDVHITEVVLSVVTEYHEVRKSVQLIRVVC